MSDLQIKIRQAQESDASDVSAILAEAASWLDSIGQPLWRQDEITPLGIERDIRAGLYFLALASGEPVGTLKFQLEDRLFWPEVREGQSALVHRLAVRRAMAGKGLSSLLLDWAKRRAGDLGRKFLRLGCAIRPQLCALYESNGFVRHSDKQVGPYHVARYEYRVDCADS